MQRISTITKLCVAVKIKTKKLMTNKFILKEIENKGSVATGISSNFTKFEGGLFGRNIQFGYKLGSKIWGRREGDKRQVSESIHAHLKLCLLLCLGISTTISYSWP